MMTRGEVALIAAQKGRRVGGVGPRVFHGAVIPLIKSRPLRRPLALKALFTKKCRPCRIRAKRKRKIIGKMLAWVDARSAPTTNPL